jgi:hypothetical protein
MGMDVYGNAPTAEVGAYFRRNVWGWRPLADFVTANAPDEAAPCKYWHSNDGTGLDAAQSVALADKLDAMLADGEVVDWIRSRDSAIAKLPDDPCRICRGTGIRTDQVGVSGGWPSKVVEPFDSDQRPNPRAGQVGSCNACRGRGSARPLATWYPLEENDVREFSQFVRASGGFRIC